METLIKIAIIAAAISLSTVSAQDKPQSNKQVLPGFHSIVVNTPVDLILKKKKDEHSISILEGNIIDAISAEVKDSVLYLNKGAGRGRYIVYVNFAKLTDIELNAKCRIKGRRCINDDILLVDIKDTKANIKLKKLKTLYTTTSGDVDVKYKGSTETHNIEMEGSGYIDAHKLLTTDGNINVDSSAEAKVCVLHNLTGNINGDGKIRCSERPQYKNITMNNTYKMTERLVPDTTQITFMRREFRVISRPKSIEYSGIRNGKEETYKIHTYWSGIGLGAARLTPSSFFKRSFLDMPDGYEYLDCRWLSSNVNINFLEKSKSLIKKHLNLVTGLGLEFNNYNFSNYYYSGHGLYGLACRSLDPTMNFVTSKLDTDKYQYRSKLVTTYFNIPLLFQFDTNPFGKANRTFHLSAGVVLGLKMGTFFKQRNIFEETIVKTRHYSPTNDYQYNAMLRFGIGKWDIYASYSLNGLFGDGLGPKLHPFTIGLTLIGF